MKLKNFGEWSEFASVTLSADLIHSHGLGVIEFRH